MDDSKIRVKATYVGHQPLLTVFEANVDLDMVVMERNEHAIKAIIPLELFIEAISVYFLTKFVLEPILNPIADKFNWKKAVDRYLKPHQPFSLIIKLENEGLLLESLPIYDHSVTANVWGIINKTIGIVQDENLIGKVTKIRFAPGSNNELIIACYQNEQLICLIDIDKGKTISTSQAKDISSSDAELSNEDWLIKQLERAAQYQQSISQQNNAEADP